MTWHHITRHDMTHPFISFMYALWYCVVWCCCCLLSFLPLLTRIFLVIVNHNNLDIMKTYVDNILVEYVPNHITCVIYVEVTTWTWHGMTWPREHHITTQHSIAQHTARHSNQWHVDQRGRYHACVCILLLCNLYNQDDMEIPIHHHLMVHTSHHEGED